MDKKVDITGTMVKAQPDWQERAEHLCRLEHWTVEVIPSPELWDQLSHVEMARMNKKITMVKEFVKCQLAGMVKGTIKYARDDWSVEQWMAHLIGEGADQANYQILLFNKWAEEAQAQKEAIDKCRELWQKGK